MHRHPLLPVARLVRLTLLGLLVMGLQPAQAQRQSHQSLRPPARIPAASGPPVITGVTPNAGPQAGGAAVQISGSGFTGATRVTFGGVPASFEVFSASGIDALSPPAAAPGPVDVVVTTTAGTSATTPADLYTYVGEATGTPTPSLTTLPTPTGTPTPSATATAPPPTPTATSTATIPLPPTATPTVTPAQVGMVDRFNQPIEPENNPATATCNLDSPHSGGIAIATGGGCLLPGSTCTIGDGCRGLLHDTGVALGSGATFTAGAGVYLHSGEFFLHAVDLQIPGRGFNWSFERKYRSGVTADGPLGHNWDFNYDARLVPVTTANVNTVYPGFGALAPGDVLRFDGVGRVDRYARRGDGSYAAPTGFFTALTRRPDGSFVERDGSGTAVLYRRPDTRGVARLAALRDRHGNTMRFVYDRQGHLARVLDTLGRPITYHYNIQGRLTYVQDFIGRRIAFGYDGNGDLVDVTSPAVTGTPNGNDFPHGKVTRYAYSRDASDPVLNHNLVAVTAPNEVATGGAARTRVHYDSQDRVVDLQFGGTNSSGIPAGGTISYAYHTVAAAGGEIDQPVVTTEARDRNGNRTVYRFNGPGNILTIRTYTNRHLQSGAPAFYETRETYNGDGKLLRTVLPAGNTTEYVYDTTNPDRVEQGNLLAETWRPDAHRGADQAYLTVTYTYEPIYDQVRTMTETRGNDPGYRPRNGGAWSPGRYTTVYTFDYQEGHNVAALAAALGVDERTVRARLAAAGLRMNLGDINGDGVTDGTAGDAIRVDRPAVHLLPDSNMARIEHGIIQLISDLYTYNRYGQRTSQRDAEGNVTRYQYYPENNPGGAGALTPGASAAPFGYLAAVVRDGVANPLRDSRTNPAPARITHHYVYDRAGNRVAEVDGRGITTAYTVNALNQVVQITYAADVSAALRNPREPHWRTCADRTLVECTRGMVAFRYRTRLYYDANNNLVRHETENRDSNNTGLTGRWINQEYRYDILDKLVTQTQEISAHPHRVAVTTYRYDRNGNRVLVLSPAANLPAGDPQRQPGNVVSYVYDERDLLHTVTRGGLTAQFAALAANAAIPELAAIPNSPDLSTTTQRHDANRNLIESRDGRGKSIRYLFDGFDRRVSVIDAGGNQSLTQYDPAGNVVRLSTFGPLGGPSPPDSRAATDHQPLRLSDLRQPLLSQVTYMYDERSRVIERDDRLFVNQGVRYVRRPVLLDGPLGRPNDGWVTARYEYDHLGRRTFAIDDNLSTSRTFYDGVGRTIRQVDPEGNAVVSTYDGDNNLVMAMAIERTSRSGVRAHSVPDLRETFTTINVYDALNRLIRSTDNLGQTSRGQFDSRDNLILGSDAQYSSQPADRIADPLGLFPAPGQDAHGITGINRTGNTVASFYDGLNRKISTVQYLRVGGQGRNRIDTSNPANPDGLIVTTYGYDANSRMIAMADDGAAGHQNTAIGSVDPAAFGGNVTRYSYDALNRLTVQWFADGAATRYAYDAADDPVRLIDANGSVIRYSYDGLRRLVRTAITRAPGVVGATVQEFQYDGLSRLTRSFDNNDPADRGDDAIVTYAYDSLGRRLEEVQNGQAVSSRWDGAGNVIALVYPNGREIQRRYDLLDRIIAIRDRGAATPVATYSYIGPRRLLERSYANGVRLTFLDDTRQRDVGYDGLGRPVRMRHLGAHNRLVAGFAYRYDRAGNPLGEQKLHSPAGSDGYGYDSAYRLVDFRRAGPAPARATQREQWLLDGLGNWQRLSVTAGSVATTQTRQHSALNQVIRQTSAGRSVTMSYDRNGNQTDDGALLLRYDGMNRLRQVVRKRDGAVLAVYSYDAAGRRTRKVVASAGALTGVTITDYYLDGWQEIEERTGASTLTQQYIYGAYVDEPLVLDRAMRRMRGVAAGGERRLFYHQNTLYSVFALTDSRGKVVEGYQYDPYGRVTVFAPGRSGVVGFGNGDTIVVGGPSGVSNPYLYTGRRLDPETGLYYYRARYLDAGQGRFLSRDPLGVRGGANLYEYVGSHPTAAVDWSGAILNVTGGDAAIMKMLNNLCPEGAFVAGPGGAVSAAKNTFCQPYLVTMCVPNDTGAGATTISYVAPPDCTRTAHPTSCCCICAAINSPQTITINNVPGSAPYTAVPRAAPGAPQPGTPGGGPANPTINIDPTWTYKEDSFVRSGMWHDVPGWVVLGHELCGHALALTAGTQALPGPTPKLGTPPHERGAVDMERLIEKEHGLPERNEDYAGGAQANPPPGPPAPAPTGPPAQLVNPTGDLAPRGGR